MDEMMGEHWWVVDGPGHRSIQREEMFKAAATYCSSAFISTMPDSDDEWICDFCNATIEVRRTVTYGPDEEEIEVAVLIPMLADNALCTDCAVGHGYPAAWQSPVLMCGCEACQMAVNVAVDRRLGNS